VQEIAKFEIFEKQEISESPNFKAVGIIENNEVIPFDADRYVQLIKLLQQSWLFTFKLTWAAA